MTIKTTNAKVNKDNGSLEVLGVEVSDEILDGVHRKVKSQAHLSQVITYLQRQVLE